MRIQFWSSERQLDQLANLGNLLVQSPDRIVDVLHARRGLTGTADNAVRLFGTGWSDDADGRVGRDDEELCWCWCTV